MGRILRPPLALALALEAILAGIVIASLAQSWDDGAEPGTQEVARLTSRMKTHCIGRFLIDMPEEAQVELARARIHGLDISAFDETKEEFQLRLAQREEEIETKQDRLGGNKNLESVKEVETDTGLVGKIFVHSRSVTEGTAGNGLENERYRYEGVAVEALVHGNGVSIDLTSERYFPDNVDRLNQLVSQLVPNPENVLPKEPGFCIDRAYFRDPLKADQREQITMFASLPRHPDIDFMLILAAGMKADEDGLLGRGAAAEAQLPLTERFRITRLRAAPRKIGGLSGEELVRRGIEENDAQVYSFWWEVDGIESDVFTPHLEFTMATGKSVNGPVQSSMSKEAALELWDKISSTIRLRPAEKQQPSMVVAPAAHRGTQVWAGDRCPQSGWWLCGDGGDGIGILGGQRQYLKMGERMPQALLLLPQTPWDKLRGLQPSVESKSRTSWKLVDTRARERVAPPLPLAKAKAVASPSTMVSFATIEGAEQQRSSIGSYSSTGSPCPASGWWRCEESHALDGTRWFAQGTLLPPATFAVAPRIFGHSSSAPQAIQRRSAWRLMRLADMPESSAADTDGQSDLSPPTQQA